MTPLEPASSSLLPGTTLTSGGLTQDFLNLSSQAGRAADLLEEGQEGTSVPGLGKPRGLPVPAAAGKTTPPVRRSTPQTGRTTPPTGRTTSPAGKEHTTYWEEHITCWKDHTTSWKDHTINDCWRRTKRNQCLSCHQTNSSRSKRRSEEAGPVVQKVNLRTLLDRPGRPSEVPAHSAFPQL